MEGNDSGGFFAVDRHAWARVCDLGVNQAVAYLILARGTGGDNRTTAWSVNAIEERTGISRPRAKMALKSLEEAGLVTVRNGGTRPRYWLNPAEDIPGSAVFLSDDDRTFISAVLEVGPPTLKQPPRFVKLAERLRALGWIKVSGDGYVVVEAGNEPKPTWIWLPNAVVDGLLTETPPVEILRQSSSIDALRIFGNLYAEHDLRDDAGLPWRDHEGIYRLYERKEVNRYGEYVIWGFPKYEATACQALLASKEHQRVHRSWEGFWPAVKILTDAGLLQFIAHLVNSHDSQGEVIHPLPVGDDGEAIELQISERARRAAEAMIPANIDPGKFWMMVPVLRHVTNVQLVGIGRLRYRPQTEATAAWLRKGGEWERWAKAYAKIGDDILGPLKQERPIATSR